MFFVVPNLMVGVGVILLLVSLVGIVAAGLQQKHVLLGYCILTAITFLITIASVITATVLRSELDQGVLQQVHADQYKQVSLYYTDASVKYDWDTLQRDFQCCGFFSFNSGYLDWSKGASEVGNADNGVPDSCCLNESPGCGRDMFADRMTDDTIYRQINTHGCMTVMNGRYERDVGPMLLVYIGIGGVLALLEIFGISLAASYIATIRRRDRVHKHTGRPIYDNKTSQHKLSDGKIYMNTLDSGVAVSSMDRRSRRSSRSDGEDRPGSAAGSNYRSSLYVEPSSTSGTVI